MASPVCEDWPYFFEGVDILPITKVRDFGINKPCLITQVLRVLHQWLMPQPFFIAFTTRG